MKKVPKGYHLMLKKYVLYLFKILNFLKYNLSYFFLDKKKNMRAINIAFCDVPWLPGVSKAKLAFRARECINSINVHFLNLMILLHFNEKKLT